MERRESLQPANRLIWVERLARLLDNQFRIPGTKFRFGLDPILNLVPVLGDMSGFLLSTAMFATILKHGISPKLAILMALNIIVDTVIGAIPLIGNIFDFYYKSNVRNMRLLREHYEEGRHQGSGWGLIAVILLVFFAVVAAILYFLLMASVWVLSRI
ncbi:uncharacterized protein DUF4112 [Arcticibacter pallidicorallinus]|uniref:Uncharacterized protein DUF4112 n=1 Tax=Arcticibacter pallidicorallinus TaxID=1259464 RepID=A0A2T0TTA1_9SPHI|nr:DUF4112 domain-containing protein [Arcticibacter pallidicorallinus]PRY48895.1 uncharacterized protein DUF4112 [Arcticibacter pallidicorallinus]